MKYAFRFYHYSRMNFPSRLSLVPTLGLLLATGQFIAQTTAKEGSDEWYTMSAIGVEGQGWPKEDLKFRYDRLPAKAEKIVRKPVWDLSRHSAGLCFRFNTDSTSIKIRYTVGGGLAMTNMPATGVSGIDLYALDKGVWKWVATLQFYSECRDRSARIG